MLRSSYLASASPARLRTLRAGGIEPDVVVSGVDESLVEATDPRTLCATLARLKAEAVAAAVRSRTAARRRRTGRCSAATRCWRSTAEILGKPADAAEATRGGSGCGAAAASSTPDTA